MNIFICLLILVPIVTPAEINELDDIDKFAGKNYVTYSRRYFSNPDKQWREKTSKRLGLTTSTEKIEENSLPQGRKEFDIGRPINPKEFEGDHNSGVKALSYLVSGDSDGPNAEAMRKALVDYELGPDGDGLAALFSDHKTAKEHIEALGMDAPGTELTEMELAAAAKLLQAHLLLLYKRPGSDPAVWEWHYFTPDESIEMEQKMDDQRPSISLKLEESGHFSAVPDIEAELLQDPGPST